MFYSHIWHIWRSMVQSSMWLWMCFQWASWRAKNDQFALSPSPLQLFSLTTMRRRSGYRFGRASGLCTQHSRNAPMRMITSWSLWVLGSRVRLLDSVPQSSAGRLTCGLGSSSMLMGWRECFQNSRSRTGAVFWRGSRGRKSTQSKHYRYFFRRRLTIYFCNTSVLKVWGRSPHWPLKRCKVRCYVWGPSRLWGPINGKRCWRRRPNLSFLLWSVGSRIFLITTFLQTSQHISQITRISPNMFNLRGSGATVAN